MQAPSTTSQTANPHYAAHKQPTRTKRTERTGRIYSRGATHSKQRRRRPRSTRERARGDAGRVAALTMVAGWGWVACSSAPPAAAPPPPFAPPPPGCQEWEREEAARVFILLGGRVLVCGIHRFAPRDGPCWAFVLPNWVWPCITERPFLFRPT